MKKSLLIRLIPVVVAVLSFHTPVLAFTGNQSHTRTLIGTSQVLDDDGK